MGASTDLALPIIFMILLNGVALGDIEVFVNDSVSMKCFPNASINIQWHHNSDENYVYAGRRLRYPYDRRFLLKKDETTGEYDLIIPNVTLQDAGMYYCSDEESGRRINSTQLIVLYMKPVCSSDMPTDRFIGPNTCNIQQENMMFSCDVVFNGSAPHLGWASENDSQVFSSSSCEVKSNRRSCSLTLRTDPSYDGSVFRCDVGQIKTDDRRYSCNTERIKIDYLVGVYAHENKYVHETVSCEVRSNLNVRYNWTLKEDNKEIFLTSKQTVSIEKPGRHQCKVKYSIRNVTCSLLACVINATVFNARTDAPEKQSNNILLAVIPTIVVVVVVLVIALIGSIIYFVRRRQLRRLQVISNEPSARMELLTIDSKGDTLLRFPLMVDFINKLNFDRDNKSSYSESNIRVDKVIDVTKFKRKIYVLCLIRSHREDVLLSTSICVFEDRSPYTIVEETLLRRVEISKFKSIISSVKDNCLYLSTSNLSHSNVRGNHYVGEVIRVEIKENGENSLQPHSKWLEFESGYWPSVLSISRDGDLTMVSGSSPYVLRIYDSDAKLLHSVKLHKDIKNAYKAIETSNGNFVIMHSMEQQTEDAASEEMNKCNEIYKREEKDDDKALELQCRSPLLSSYEKDRPFWFTVSEVSRDGKTIIRRFIPENQQQQLTLIYEGDFCTDSRDRVFVADTMNRRVVVLDSYLRWIGIPIPRVKNDDENENLRWPLILFYDEDSHEMIIAEENQVKIYNLIWEKTNTFD